VHQAKINAIRNRKAADFDQAYRTDQVQAHQQTIAVLDTYAIAGGDPAMKAWASKALPMVRRHVEHLQALGMGSGSR
jgi:putative membrane protein